MTITSDSVLKLELKISTNQGTKSFCKILDKKDLNRMQYATRSHILQNAISELKSEFVKSLDEANRIDLDTF